MPGGHVLVRQPRGDVEHDDRALPVDVVAVSEAAELLLPCRVPAVEAQLAPVGREVQRVHLHAHRRCTTRHVRAAAAGAGDWTVQMHSRAARWAAAGEQRGCWCCLASASTQQQAKPGAHAHTSSQTRRSDASSQRWSCLRRTSMRSQQLGRQSPACRPSKSGQTSKQTSKLCSTPVPPSPTSTSLKDGTPSGVVWP